MPSVFTKFQMKKNLIRSSYFYLQKPASDHPVCFDYN